VDRGFTKRGSGTHPTLYERMLCVCERCEVTATTWSLVWQTDRIGYTCSAIRVGLDARGAPQSFSDDIPARDGGRTLMDASMIISLYRASVFGTGRIKRSRYSSVGRATRYGLDGPGIEYR
jgi:hypothetical protein